MGDHAMYLLKYIFIFCMNIKWLCDLCIMSVMNLNVNMAVTLSHGRLVTKQKERRRKWFYKNIWKQKVKCFFTLSCVMEYVSLYPVINGYNEKLKMSIGRNCLLLIMIYR